MKFKIGSQRFGEYSSRVWVYIYIYVYVYIKSKASEAYIGLICRVDILYRYTYIYIYIYTGFRGLHKFVQFSLRVGCFRVWGLWFKSSCYPDDIQPRTYPHKFGLLLADYWRMNPSTEPSLQGRVQKLVSVNLHCLFL